MAVGIVRHQLSNRNFKKASYRVSRSLLNHPFLMIMLLLLIYLHLYFPFLFSLLVTASPVLICTALLLGTLLIHGKLNQQNVNYHEETSYNSTPVTSGSGTESNSYSIDRDSIFSRDIFAEVRKDIVEKGMLSPGVRKENKNDYGFSNFENFNFQKRLDQGSDKNIGVYQDVNDQFEFPKVVNEGINASHDVGFLKSEFESLDSNQSSDNSGEDENDDGIVEDKIVEGESGDRLTNSWIELEKSQHLESLITKTGNEDEIEDYEGTDNVDIDENIEEEDDDDEGENSDIEKDVTKHVTMWTEEDEKNLRLVGNSELERDLRLENLLARRRAKRNFSKISVRNLTDFDRPDQLSFQVPQISIMRANPFDSPLDTNQENFDNIPPIPGSAPSVSVPRKNPFDTPCTSPKKVQNFTQENFQNNPDEFNETGSSRNEYYHQPGNVRKPKLGETNRKDAVFRRYDSFSTGCNFPGDDISLSDLMETDRRVARLKRRETFTARSASSNMLGPPEKLSFPKLKPVFVPEKVDRVQEVVNSSGRESSHDSESHVSSSESDIDDVGPSKAHFEHDLDNEGPTEEDHVSSHSNNSSIKSSEEIHSLHDDLDEGIVGSSLEVNAEINADQINQKVQASHHENHDNEISSTTSLISEVVHISEKIGQDEDEIVKESGFSPKASSIVSDSVTEPPGFDLSSSGIEKTTPFSSSPTHD